MQQFNLKLFLDFLQTKINFLLEHDKLTQDKLTLLKDKTVAIVLQNMNITVYVDFVDHYFYLNTEKHHEPSLTLKGTPSAFLRLMKQSENYTVTQAIQVEGDLHLAQILQSSLRDLNIDWVEILAPYTGDVVAGSLEQTALGAKKWWQSTQQALWENAADFIQDEATFVASKVEVEDFVNKVSQLQQSIDRLSMRIAKIKQQVEI